MEQPSHETNLQPVVPDGVADFGYDLYLLAITKLLHDQYFRLLGFHFQTLIQQRLPDKVKIPEQEKSISSLDTGKVNFSLKFYGVLFL